jgi:hypothetical protein
MDDLVEGAMIIKTLNKAEKKELQDLIKLYWESYYNPPEGVIGVGKITYAEKQIVLAQVKP